MIAHHLSRNGTDLLTVDIDRAASKRNASVDIESGITGHIDGTARDDQIPVRVDAVRIPRTDDDRDASVVDFNGRRVPGLLRGIDPIVRDLLSLPRRRDDSEAGLPGPGRMRSSALWFAWK